MEHISIKVKGQDGSELYFSISTTYQLRRLLNFYCDRKSLDINYTTFLFGGRKICPDQTPVELGILDGGEIEVEQHVSVIIRGPADQVFYIKKTMSLGNLMRHYCEGLCIDINSTAFLYKGVVLQPEQTPYQLGMEVGDVIEAMVQQPSIYDAMHSLRI